MKKFIDKIKNNKKISIFIMLFVVAATVTLIFVLTKNTFATEEADTISISCSPSVVLPGDSIMCSLNGNFAVNAIDGIQATFENTEGLIYNKITLSVSEEEADEWWSLADEGGFAIVKYTEPGVSGSVELATFKFTIPETASSNDIYTVKLTDIILDANGDSIYLEDDVSSEVRVKSDVNTIDSLKVNGTALTIGENDTYTTTVDSEKVTISVDKTDVHSSVSGDVGEVSLNYGTNILSIVVTSETGVDKTYNVSIYRPFVFNTEAYIYDKTNNYIYTKNNNTSNDILSNISGDIPAELTASVTNNKLIIKNSGNESLINIDLINFKLTGSTIVDSNVYVSSGITYDAFMNGITTNGVTVKVYNGANEVTSSTMQENYKVKIYYSNTNTLLDEYTVKEEVFVIDESLSVDSTSNIIQRIVNGSNYSDIENKITTTGTFSMMRGNTTLSSSDKIRTGDKFTINMLNGSKFEYTTSVLGDITGSQINGKVVGNGIIDNGDVAILYRYLKRKANLEDYQVRAGDIISDGVIKINDVSRLYRYYKGKVNALEVD